jgi:hypothetical protein
VLLSPGPTPATRPGRPGRAARSRDAFGCKRGGDAVNRQLPQSVILAANDCEPGPPMGRSGHDQGGIHGRGLFQACTPVTSATHGRQLRDASVLAPLKALISTHSGCAGRPAGVTSRLAASPGPGHLHRVSAESTMPSAIPGRLLRPFENQRKTLIKSRSGVVRTSAGPSKGGNPEA